MRNIPFFNYPALYENQAKDLQIAIMDVCTRGAYILQEDLKNFERNLAKFLNVKHVFGVANGTDALWMGLLCAGIGRDDEVILPSHTYIASAAAINFVGAIPILADISSDHMIDPDSVLKLITKKTKAIMPVQVNGRTCDMHKIMEIASAHNLLVVEDAAQGLGSKFMDQFAGTFGLFGTISFYPAKLLGCFGDGGAIVTNNDEFAEKIFQMRDHGRNHQGEVVSWGINSRLDNLQAAILNTKFSNFSEDISRRREIASLYQMYLGHLTKIKLPPSPIEGGINYDVYQNYEIEAEERDSLKVFLEKNGVRTLIQWSGMPLHKFSELRSQISSVPKTELFFDRCLMLPMNTSITNDDVLYICNLIKVFYGE